MQTNYPTYDQVIELRGKMREAEIQHWLHDDLFKSDWFLLLFLAIIPWVIWYKFLDHSRRSEILIYGLMVTIAAIVLDALGTEMMLWGYPNKLVVLVPPLLPSDLAIIPVAYMLVYQCFTTWRSFILASMVLAAVFAFIGEPILVFLGIYVPYEWKHIYSFPIYITVAIFLRWVTIKVVK
jgi:hypothetical protein